MRIFHKRVYGRVLKVSVVLMMTVIITLAFAACGNDSDKPDAKPTQEATVATDVTGTEANEPAIDPTGSAGNSSSGGASSGSASGGDIGESQVIAIVLAKVPGATAANIAELEKENDDGRLTYEGSVQYNGYEYEFEVDGATGNILKWEIDD
ncbi:MAG: hypothetical protein GXX92_06860 [Clostridiales bacterium]|nr:hypothetical protein [Clostridiales bacterium]